MYPSFILLITIILLKPSIVYATPAPPRVNNPTPLVLANSPSSHPPHRNSTASNIPLTFLGVDCYHLNPTTDRVSLLSCEAAFAGLVRDGNVYREHKLYNAWRYQLSGQHCSIAVISPSRKDRWVKISFAKVVLYATEVLQSCETGGANVFEGEWRVVVTREYMKNVGRLGGSGMIT